MALVDLQSFPDYPERFDPSRYEDVATRAEWENRILTGTQVAHELIEAAKHTQITGVGEGKERALSGHGSDPFKPVSKPNSES